MPEPTRISDWPWVIVRVSCPYCKRAGAYRLARLAEKFGAECGLDALLDRLAFDCPYRRPGVKPRKYVMQCGARFTDLEGPQPPPPDVPASARVVELRVVRGGRE